MNRPGFVGDSNFQIGWSDDEQISDERHDEQVLSICAGAGGADGAGARVRTFLALGGGAIDRRQDRLLGAHDAGMGEEGRGPWRHPGEPSAGRILAIGLLGEKPAGPSNGRHQAPKPP
jgi:hypothetical protein